MSEIEIKAKNQSKNDTELGRLSMKLAEQQ